MKNKNDNTSPSRRRFLQHTIALLPLAVAGKSVLPGKALAEEGEDQNGGYVPHFFRQEEWQFILAATDRLIPADELGPGAVGERVPVFIDRQMELPYGYGHLWYMHPPFSTGAPEMGYQSSLVPRETYRRGIKAVNEHCQGKWHRPFSELSHEQQEQILTELQNGELTFETVPGQLFFTQLLENTHEGFLADPIHGGNHTLAAWKMIGFPGARADYQQVMDAPGKPYPLVPVSISGKRGEKA